MSDMKFNALLKECEINDFAGLIHIRKKDDLLFEYIEGCAQRAEKIMIDANTRFGIASGTKLVTALCIGLLISRGQMTLNTKAKSLYDLQKELVDPDITIAQLLCHSSGLPDYYDEDLIDDFDTFELDVPVYHLVSPFDYLPLFPDRQMDFSPGSAFKYNNGAYVYLAMIIEAVSGMSYQRFVEEELFRPLGITRSGVFASNDLPAGTAYGYVKTDTGWTTNIFKLPVRAGGDGGIYMTSADLLKLWQGFMANEIIPCDLVQAFITPQQCVDAERGIYYGYGLWLKRKGESYIPFIVGSDAGVSFKSVYDYRQETFMMAVSNTNEDVWNIIVPFNALIGEL